YPNALDAAAVAIVYGSQNNKELKLKWLKTTVDKGQSFPQLTSIAQLALEALQKNQPLPKDKILPITNKEMNRWELPAACLFAGQLLLQAGDKDAAIPLFQKGLNA